MRRIRLWIALLLLASGTAYARPPLAGFPTATLTVGGSERPGDSGLTTIDFNGFTETVYYGQFSNQASLASALAAMFTRDYIAAGLYAKAGANNNTDPNVITFQLVTRAPFGPINIQASTASFSFTPLGFASNSGTNWDQGTVTLSLNGVAIAAADYGDGSTAASVAHDLTLNASSSDVTVTSESFAPGQANLILQSRQTGSFTDSYSLTFSTSASFSSPQPNGTLSSSTAAAPATVYSYNAIFDPAGNVSGLADSVMGMWAYGYDSLNRVTNGQASSTGGGSYAGQYTCWSYDSFGNRLSESISATPCGSSPPATYAATYSADNRIASVSAPANVTIQYDVAGNVLNDGFNNYIYDAEGRLCAVHGPQGMIGYQYDADGNRIGKGMISTMSCDLTSNGYTPMTDFVLDQSAQMTEVAVAMANGIITQTWNHTNVTANGRLIATYDTTASGLHFYLNDPLGSRRVQTNAAGFAEQTCQSLPFGEQLFCTGSLSSPTENHFTGKESDAESGLDYFWARYYGSPMGRFMSPDPSGLLAQNPADPQSWNLYAYVRNNPLIFTDPTGLDCVHLTDDRKGVQSVDSGSCKAGSGGYYVPGTYNNRAAVNSDGIIIGLESTVGYTGFISNFDVNGNIQSMNIMEAWELPQAGTVDHVVGDGVRVSDPWTQRGLAALYLAGQDPDAKMVSSVSGIAKFYGLNLLGAAGEGLAGLDSMQIGIGSPEINPRYHFVYGTDGVYQQGLLRTLRDKSTQMMLEEGPFAERTYGLSPIKFSLPVMSGASVLGEAGPIAGNCFTATCSAFFRGWF